MSACVVVTGAAGFLGRHVARELAGRGHAVVGLGYDCWDAPGAWEAWGVRHWRTAAVTLEALESLAADHGPPAAVIHCAGGSSVGYSIEHPREDFLATVCSAVDVLEFARRRAPAVQVIYPSSAAVYGASGALPLHEALAPAPISPYGLHKRMVEDLCRGHGARYGVPSALVRFFSLYGNGLCKQLLWDACTKAAAGAFTFFGTGEEQRDWLHVEDAARLLVLAMDHASAESPVVNGAAGVGVSIREILTRLGALLSPPRTPGFSQAAKPGDPSHLVADVARARAWGFVPQVALDAGLADYVRWFNARREERP
ncbi:MAG: NAD-dependent epimerase/dehydratase family protein [Desulfovibrio sp.]|nr:NAD-dependent epimerase/dehydratase family protein [Desulfovibrio sp.]